MAPAYKLLSSAASDDLKDVKSVKSSERSDWIGLNVLRTLHRDAVILMLCKTVRMFGFGFLTVMVRRESTVS